MTTIPNVSRASNSAPDRDVNFGRVVSEIGFDHDMLYIYTQGIYNHC